ncbi:GrpE-domain-containing protein [Epithele typhae]|uniref:GrpE-domain-containing protein n=1 Tax=Epithele typhae TaxID=378194 RepID=UPI0020086F38|nr:GrpE-domain-containing protein [Epithele typhae]KAH9945925.1 GrpE-domain-containing protein [Epithele typhae]
MFNAQAVQAFRSCTGALSSRTLARSSVNAVGRTVAFASRSRYYSDKAGSSSKVEEEEKEKDSVDVSPDAELLSKLKAEEAKVADCMSRLRYLQADFLNLQRNAAKDKEQARDFAITKFAGDLLETVDVLSLALKSVPKEYTESPPQADSSSDTPTPKTADDHIRELYVGVEATQRLLLYTLFKHHVKPFDPTGEQFDPNKHEAMYQAPIPGKEPGSVLECAKVGYTIKGRVLRAAQVGVVQDTRS